MREPTKRHTHLWNDLPIEERARLMPYEQESQVLHLCQVRNLMIRNHKRALAEIDDWIGNIQDDLPKQT